MWYIYKWIKLNLIVSLTIITIIIVKYEQQNVIKLIIAFLRKKEFENLKLG